MTMAMVNSHLQSLEEVPPMIAVVGSTLLQKLKEWPDAPPELAHLAATCVVLADTIAWRCEEALEALRETLPIQPELPTPPLELLPVILAHRTLH